MTEVIRKEILRLMEGYARNPSNSNKYYHSMLALFESQEVYEEEND